MRRGEIYYCNQSVTGGDVIWSENRPCVIVSNNRLAETSTVVDVVFLTSQEKKPMPTHAPVTAANRPGIALCEQIVAVPKSALRDYMATCTPAEMAAIDDALIASLGLDARLDFAEPIDPAPLAAAGASIRETKERCDQELLLVTRAERDTYKQMYDALLAHLTGARS